MPHPLVSSPSPTEETSPSSAVATLLEDVGHRLDNLPGLLLDGRPVVAVGPDEILFHVGEFEAELQAGRLPVLVDLIGIRLPDGPLQPLRVVHPRIERRLMPVEHVGEPGGWMIDDGL